MARIEVSAPTGSKEWQNQMLLAIHEEQTTTNQRLTDHIEQKPMHTAPPCRYMQWLFGANVSALVAMALAWLKQKYGG